MLSETMSSQYEAHDFYYISWDQRISSFHWINRCIITIVTIHQLLQTFLCVITPHHLRSYDKIRKLIFSQVAYLDNFFMWNRSRTSLTSRSESTADLSQHFPSFEVRAAGATVTVRKMLLFQTTNTIPTWAHMQKELLLVLKIIHWDYQDWASHEHHRSPCYVHICMGLTHLRREWSPWTMYSMDPLSLCYLAMVPH